MVRGDIMKLVDYAETEIIPFLRDMLEKTHAKGYVLGLSGGIDSALVSLLAVKAVGKDKVFHLILPCASKTTKDVDDAVEFAKKFDLTYKIVNLTSTFDSFIQENKELTGMSVANVKVRLRMVTLYAYSQQLNYLVLGTDNWDENYTGYFTKHGDGACDLLPIVELTKSEVFALSRHYGCTETILNRAPSASLWEGQTDETEMGITYDELDSYLLHGKENLSEKTIQRIEHLHQVSEHKRNLAPRPNKYIRD